MRVALYLRVSTQEQATEGWSIGEQDERLRSYCKAMLWDVYKVYVDPGYSGGNINRPGLQDLIKDVKSGIIDKVVVYKLDRLSRSQYDTLYLIEKVFLANNTDFVSMTESFSTDSSLGRAMIGFLAVFAQLEKDKINERMSMGKEARAKDGKWHGGGTEPIGYDFDSATDELVINDYEQIQLRELRELFLKGTPLRRIEKIFKDKGYTHKHGTWTPKTMRRVLRSKIYIGMIKYNDQWFPGRHEPTLDIETHEDIIKLLDNRAEQFKRFNFRSGTPTTYLGGLLYCKHCGAKYAKDSQRQRNNKPSRLIYACYSRNKKMKSMIKDPTCKNKNWTIDELDQLVINEIKKLAADSSMIDDIRTDHQTNSDSTNKVAVIKKEIAKLNEQISRFMDLYGIGKFTIDQVSSKVDPLNEQKRKLEKELESLNVDTHELTKEETMRIVESFDDILSRNDFNEIRLTIESLIYYIELDHDDITIHWKFV